MRDRACYGVKRPSPSGRWLWAALSGLMGLTGWAAGGSCVRADELVAITGGRIIPVVGQELERGTILIRNGRIAAVAAEVEVPVEARVIDATGQTILPGFIDVHSSDPMSQSNERNPNVPFLSVVDTIDPQALYFDDARRNGITAVSVVPGNSTMIGGQTAVVRTAGTYVNDMLIASPVGVKLSLRPPSGSRMSHLAALRRELDRAKGTAAADAGEAADTEPSTSTDGGNDAGGEGDSPESPPASPPSGQGSEAQQQGLEVLRQLVGGQLLAFIYCDLPMDVVHALELIKAYDLKPILILGRECDRAASLLADLPYPIVLDPRLVYWRTRPNTRREERVDVPAVFHGLGKSFLLQADTTASRQTLGSGYLWYQAAVAVKSGLSREQAIQALTLAPAQALGIDDSVGSIEVGKDADLVILTGDPLGTLTWVDKTLVGGEVVYDRSQDEFLRRLLEATEQ
jgi:imidazolonepropionase-like amidohydrolase